MDVKFLRSKIGYDKGRTRKGHSSVSISSWDDTSFTAITRKSKTREHLVSCNPQMKSETLNDGNLHWNEKRTSVQTNPLDGVEKTNDKTYTTDKDATPLSMNIKNFSSNVDQFSFPSAINAKADTKPVKMNVMNSNTNDVIQNVKMSMPLMYCSNFDLEILSRMWNIT